MKKRVLAFLVSMLTLALIGGGITGCNNDPDNTPSNPFAGKTFYGTVNGSSYDVCKLDFTSDSKVTLTLYGQGEAGADVVENLTYTVSDGIATVDYKGQKITTTKIENDTFKASLDGTEANTASFTTKANPAPAKPETPVKPTDPEKPTEPTDPEKPAEPTDPETPVEPTDPETPVEPTDPEKPVEPTDPETPVEPTDPETPVEPTDPETPVENPFAGKTFYGTGYGSSYDICKLDFTSDLKATLTYYGLGEAGDDLVFNSTYTVSDGIATLDYQGDKVTTTKIENDTFKVSKDGTEEHAISFTTKANPAPAKPETPVKPTDPETPAENPFAGKTFYGTVDGYPYDVCKLNFTSDSEVTLTLYGEGEAGADVILDLTYTVSDGIATVDYEGQKLTTTKIENDTFKASLDGTEENTASFTTNANPAPATEEQTEFIVTLDSCDPTKKIPVIKVIREITGLGLYEAKDLVEGAPKTVKEGVSKADADAMIAKITEAGGNASKALIGGGVTDCNNDPDNTASNSSPAAEEQTEFTVTLDSFDAAKKIPVIKVIREITGLGLGEAKALVEGAPKTVKEGVSKADADAMIAKITEAGGKASKALIGGGVTDCNNDPDNTASNSSPAAEEQTEFTVTLDSFDPAKKIPVIKVIREITGLELGEAKALVEGAPKTVKEGVSKADADAMIAKITEAGGNASKK